MDATSSGHQGIAGLLLLLCVASLYPDISGYVLCPTPIRSPHGGFNVSVVPPNQPVYSNGTGLIYWCDRHYTFRSPFNVNPVTCGDNGKWKTYGFDPSCDAINCTKPIISNGSGIVVVGTNYSQGAIIQFTCEHGWETLEPTAVCLGPEWSNKYNPWCTVVTCLDITRSQNASIIPYGYTNITALGIRDPLAPGVPRRVHQYQAEVSYTCASDTEMIGTRERICNASGMWSGNQPFCYVKADMCRAVTPCPSAKVCCEWGPEGALGLSCCLPETRSFIGERFSNLTRQCFTALEDNFIICMTQIVKCLDNKDDNSCINQYILPYYMYGCNQNLGDAPQQYRTDYYDDHDLVEFCKRDQKTTACTEYQVDYTGVPPTDFRSSARTCLPKKCISDTTTDLLSLAKSTLNLRCLNQKNVYERQYCSISSVRLNCSDGTEATAHYGGSCNCSAPLVPAGATECCTLNGTEVRCCLPRVKTMFDDRLPAGLPDKCTASIKDNLKDCSAIIADCLGGLEGSKRDYPCPSYHSCAASTQRYHTCPNYYRGYNHSLWCVTTCRFPNDPSRSCIQDDFCLSQACNATSDIHTLAMSDAKVICSYDKLTHDVRSCDEVEVTWFCSDSSGTTARSVTATYRDPIRPMNVGGIVGGVVAGVIIIVGIFLVGIIVKRRRQQRVKQYGQLSVHHSNKPNENEALVNAGNDLFSSSSSSYGTELRSLDKERLGYA